MRVRREQPGDEVAIRAIHGAAFREPGRPDRVPVEVALVDALRESKAGLPSLSLLALADGQTVGHVLCTRAQVEETPVLALGPIGVVPTWQNIGVGRELMDTVIHEADVMGEPLIGLAGSHEYYSRFEFVPGSNLGVTLLVPDWEPAFQVLTLGSYRPAITGRFDYAEAFYDL
jgi:putative acetyltransferase